MTDKERVIKGLEVCTDVHAVPVCRDCPYQEQRRCQSLLMDDALKLLKEQPDVVRCGECKYYSNGFCYNPNTFDEKTCGNTVPNWFCADGKRRHEDV